MKFERYNNGINPDIIYGPGPHLVGVWDHMMIYRVSEMKKKESLYINTIDGIAYRVDITISFQVVPDRIGYLEQQIGRDYYQIVVLPEVKDALSDFFNKYEADIISFDNFEELESFIFVNASKPIRENYVELLSVEIEQLAKQ